MDITTIIFVACLLIIAVIAFRFGKTIGARERDYAWKQELPNQRKDAVMRSRAVLGGHFSEQLAPYLPGFKYSPTECKFLGKPIDLIVFRGSDNKKIEEIVFLEVKSGKSKLSTQERNLKEAIEQGNVRWEEYRANLDEREPTEPSNTKT